MWSLVQLVMFVSVWVYGSLSIQIYIFGKIFSWCKLMKPHWPRWSYTGLYQLRICPITHTILYAWIIVIHISEDSRPDSPLDSGCCVPLMQSDLRVNVPCHGKDHLSTREILYGCRISTMSCTQFPTLWPGESVWRQDNLRCLREIQHIASPGSGDTKVF